MFSFSGYSDSINSKLDLAYFNSDYNYEKINSTLYGVYFYDL